MKMKYSGHFWECRKWRRGLVSEMYSLDGVEEEAVVSVVLK